MAVERVLLLLLLEEVSGVEIGVSELWLPNPGREDSSSAA